MEWNQFLQAVVIAVSTWFLRRQAARDRDNVTNLSHVDAVEIRAEIRELRQEVKVMSQLLHREMIRSRSKGH